MGENAAVAAQKLVYELRSAGISAEFDHMSRSLKAQMKYADKLGAVYTAVLGDNEIESGIVKIKKMENGEQSEVALDELPEFLGR